MNSIDYSIQFNNYISQYNESIKQKLIELRKQILVVDPSLKERISYNMPSFYKNNTLLYFGGFKNHIGFFPTPSAIIHFKNDLKGFKYSKGSIHFSINEELPKELIISIVKFRILEDLKCQNSA